MESFAKFLGSLAGASGISTVVGVPLVLSSSGRNFSVNPGGALTNQKLH